MNLPPRPRRVQLSAVLMFVALMAATGSPAESQNSFERSSVGGHLGLLSANALLGALTGGIRSELAGGSFVDGFAAGALGGSVVYGGKLISAEQFDGAGFLGREFAAVGTSIVNNAAAGDPMFARLMFPVGPLHVYVTPGNTHPVNVRASLYNLYWIGYSLVEPELELDVGRSFSAGTLVFNAPRRTFRSGSNDFIGAVVGSTILLSSREARTAFQHERVHVVQLDFLSQTWGLPLERYVGRRLPLLPSLQKYVDFDITLPAMGWFLSRVGGLDRSDDPLEIEADFLDSR